MEKLEHILANLGKVREATLHGKDYLVAPATLIVEGVLNGSDGPLFYPKDEYNRDPWAWNGMPIVLRHPTQNGMNVSARNPKVLEKYWLGNVYEAGAGDNLKAEAWFNVEAVQRVDRSEGTDILNRLRNGLPIEVSTGLGTDQDPKPGSHNGLPYRAVARNYRPDHLAVLPDQKGACSNDDGCGINVNEAKVSDENRKSLWEKLGHLLGITDNGGPGSGPQKGGGQSDDTKPFVTPEGDKVLATEAQWKAFKQERNRVKQELTNSFRAQSEEQLRNEVEGRGIRALGSTKHDLVKALVEHDLPSLVPAVFNAGLYGNPQSTATGLFKRHGSGTGKGDVHEAAQRGSMAQCSPQQAALGADAKAQADAGHNPPNWAVNEDLWEKAKAAADKGDYGEDTYYAVVTHIYEKMGGTIESKNQTGNQTQEGTDMTRDQNIQWLTANCDCYKGKEKVLANKDNYTDDDLAKLKANAEKGQANEQIANALAKPVKVGKREMALTFNAAANSIVANETKKDEEDEEEVEEEEEEVENKGKKKEGKKTANKLTIDDLPPDLRTLVNHAKETVDEAKEQIVRQLIANVAEAEKQSEGDYLMTKDLKELRRLLKYQPTANKQPHEPERKTYNWTGAAGGAPVENREDLGEPFDLDKERESYDPFILNMRAKEKQTA